jgi:DMSO/TMAO reductase YedYZ molybdopterin-dependent catalytic subunit
MPEEAPMKTTQKPKIVCVSEKTISRRSLLEWLGTASVMALGGELLASCGHSQSFDPVSGEKVDGGWDAEKENEPSDGGFALYPGNTDTPLFQKWPERTVDRQELNDILARWTLRVDGLTEAPQTLSFSDILSLPRQDQVTDFHCVEGWSVHDVPWNGLHFSELFKRVVPSPQATHLTLYSVGDVYLESIPIEVARESKTILAYGIDGATIPLAHGFPLRLVVPRMLAYKNAKYVYRIELTDKPINGFWVQNGYSYEGKVPESRLREGKY